MGLAFIPQHYEKEDLNLVFRQRRMQKKYAELIDQSLTMYDYIRCGQINLGKDIFDNSVRDLRAAILERIQDLEADAGTLEYEEYTKIREKISGPEEKLQTSKETEIISKFQTILTAHEKEYDSIKQLKHAAVMKFQFRQAEQEC